MTFPLATFANLVTFASLVTKQTLLLIGWLQRVCTVKQRTAASSVRPELYVEC